MGADRPGSGARAGWAAAVLLFCGAGPSPAQFELSANLANPNALQYEPVIVILKVSNTGPYPATVGGEGGAVLSFRVEREAGRIVDEQPPGLILAPFMVPPRETVTREVNVARAYDLRKTGSYTLYARLDHRGTRSRSGRMYLDVVPGLIIHEQRVMTRSGSRTISLRTLQRDRVMHLFCRIEDEQRQICYGVHDLGRLLRHDPTGILVDSEDLIHVLHQSGPTRYSHSIFGADGTPIRQEYVAKGNRSAELAIGEGGDVVVQGGLSYEGDSSVDRPRIRPFNPFSSGLPDRSNRNVPNR